MLAAALCQAIYIPFGRGMGKYYWWTNKRLGEIMNGSSPHDILFLGSSRTMEGSYPMIIDSICHADSYNAGMGAANMTVLKMLFDGYYVHHPFPKIVVLNLDLFSFSKPDNILNPPQYYAYLNNPAVYQTLNAYGHKAGLHKYIPFLRVADFDDNSKVFAIRSLLGMKKTELPDDLFEYKGFLSPHTEHMVSGPDISKAVPENISDTAVAYLQSMIDTCQTHHVKLIFTYLPEYYHGGKKTLISNNKDIFEFITRTAQKNNIDFLRYDSLPLCYDMSSFWDPNHLNRAAAMSFSRIEAEDIKTIMQRDK